MRKLRLKGNKRHVQGCTANKTVFLLSFTISPLTTFKERKRFLLQRKEISTAREVQDVERSIFWNPQFTKNPLICTYKKRKYVITLLFCNLNREKANATGWTLQKLGIYFFPQVEADGMDLFCQFTSHINTTLLSSHIINPFCL